jgi:hypothetical protein
MAPNISLQNLILSANEKRDEVVTKLKKKQESMLKSKEFSAGDFGMGNSRERDNEEKA